MARGNVESVVRFNHLNHRLSQHNSRENEENLKGMTIVTNSRRLFFGINRGNKLNKHNFIYPIKEIKDSLAKFCFTLYL